jgi:hypothetical protein
MRLKSGAMVLAVLVMVGVLSGCGSLRFAPGEKQKQNAYLHHRTLAAAVVCAGQEEVSADLAGLTEQALRQSDAIVAYYGLPRELPGSESVAEILSGANDAVTEGAQLSAGQRPDPWDVADNLLELGIALAGIVGGVYGGRVVAGLKLAREKSIALKEIVMGNELFKKQNPDRAGVFKQAQSGQSVATRNLVAVNK